MSVLQSWMPAQADPQVPVNENFEALEHMAVYGKDATTTAGLTWGYLGGRWDGHAVAAGTVALAASSTLYMVVARATGVLSVSGSSANWIDTAAYARVYKLTTGPATVTAVEDWRAGGYGVHGQGTSSGGGSAVTAIPIACSDESTALAAGVAKVTFRMPFAMNLSAVRASLTTAQAGGAILTVDINAGGSSILSTKLTIDNTEKTSTTAAAAAVISSAALADDAELTIDIDQIGDGSAKGLKVYLIGVPA
ncbi:hypothetical protein [Comamonas thiooxydans]|uniref:hypothetical protein n=1 Tax=Comamonas thiooxydans TaxID=363952 RepID=UPI000B100AF1|nr:hypothetical protein [Comamonas thiooxydans]